MTRVDRVAAVGAAVFCLVLGIAYLLLGLKHTVDGIPKWLLTVIGIGMGSGLLIGCRYFAQKAWIGKRKLPEER